MARYFMHLRDGADELLDPDGREFLSVDEVRRAVLFVVRDLIAADVRDGMIDLRFRIDAEDEGGTLVYSLPFAGAVTIIPAPRAA